MAQHDVFKNTSGEGYILELQANLLDGLSTRVVVPLLPKNAAPKPASRLNPIFEIEGENYVMVTQFLAAVPRNILKEPVTNLAERADVVTNALDLLFHGI